MMIPQIPQNKASKINICIDLRIEQIFKLKYNLENTGVVLLAIGFDKVPNFIVKVKEQGEFLTSIQYLTPRLYQT